MPTNTATPAAANVTDPSQRIDVDALLTPEEATRLTRFGTKKKIKVWYADPPWDIAQKGKRGAIQHYNLRSSPWMWCIGDGVILRVRVMQ